MCVLRRFAGILLLLSVPLPAFAAADTKPDASSETNAAVPGPVGLGNLLAARLAGLPAEKLVLVGLVPTGSDASVSQAHGRLLAIKRDDCLVISADEGKLEEKDLFLEVVRALGITDFPYAVICSASGEPLIGGPVGFETTEQLGSAMEGWLRDARRVKELGASFSDAGSGGQPELIAELLKLQGGAFAVACRPGLVPLLEQGRWQESGQLGDLAKGALEAAAKRSFQQAFDEIMPALAEATGEGGLDKPLDILRKVADRPELSPLVRQRFEMQGFRLCANARDYDRALQYLDRAEKAAPDSQIASRIPKFRAQIISARKNARNRPSPQESGAPPSNPPVQGEPPPPAPPVPAPSAGTPEP